MTQGPGPEHREAIKSLKSPDEFNRYRESVEARATAIVRDHVASAQEASRELVQRGYARYIGCSFHNRAIAKLWLEAKALDVVMLRYSPCHTGAETELAAYLRAPVDKRPGVICFNTAMGMSYASGSPRIGELIPFPHTHLYRFAWRQPWADVVLAAQ